MSRALQYQHAEWSRQDVACYPPGGADNSAARARFADLAENSANTGTDENLARDGGIELY